MLVHSLWTHIASSSRRNLIGVVNNVPVLKIRILKFNLRPNGSVKPLASTRTEIGFLIPRLMICFHFSAFGPNTKTQEPLKL